MWPYLTLLAIVAVWAFFALRDEPRLRDYALIYGINAIVAIATESVTAIARDTYSFGGFPNFFIVAVGIEPLLGVLYAHYCDRNPYARAMLAATILGGPIEKAFLWTGAYRYDRGWHPLLTMICFTGYFLWTRFLLKLIREGRIGAGRPRLPS